MSKSLQILENFTVDTIHFQELQHIFGNVNDKREMSFVQLE